MILILAHRTYAKLFTAQVIALLGTGLLTIALGLLAFDVAAGDAGVVMGLAMTIKMIAYVAAAPVATALVSSLPRQAVLIGADLVRAAVAVSLPFVSQAWQIYPLVFVLQCASATFTPTFQAVIPSVLPDEKNYTRALSLSRLAYDVESLLSPVLAAALLSVISYHNLFVGTVIGFLASAVLVAASRLPAMGAPERSPFLQRLTDGMRLFGCVRKASAFLYNWGNVSVGTYFKISISFLYGLCSILSKISPSFHDSPPVNSNFKSSNPLFFNSLKISTKKGMFFLGSSAPTFNK